jgi:hypothetical protein
MKIMLRGRGVDDDLDAIANKLDLMDFAGATDILAKAASKLEPP